MLCLFFFKQKTAYELRISDWSADVCSSDLRAFEFFADRGGSVGQTASGEHEAARSRPDGEVARFDARGAHLRAEPLFQLGTRAGLHPRRDFLAAQFEKKVGHFGSSPARGGGPAKLVEGHRPASAALDCTCPSTLLRMF